VAFSAGFALLFPLRPLRPLREAFIFDGCGPRYSFPEESFEKSLILFALFNKTLGKGSFSG
jgi:hypothetical protein